MKEMITCSPELQNSLNVCCPAAETNDAAAQFRFAKFLLENEKDTMRGLAFALFKELAKQSYTPIQTDAQYMLGKCYENGYGITKSYPRAIRWYDKAGHNVGNDLSKHPNPVREALIEAVFETVETHDVGFDKGLEEILFGKITPESIARKTKAAENGDVEAQKYLMDLYNGGAGYIEDNQVQSAYWAERAAKNGDTKAMEKIGDRYYYGKGVEKDYKMALYWLKKAAKQGAESPAYQVGKHYKSQKQYKEAVKWYRKYAELKIERRNDRLGWKIERPVVPSKI